MIAKLPTMGTTTFDFAWLFCSTCTAFAIAVPIDLPLAGLRALVVSGPNTGGKTVAMKCIGLMALMAQSGLPVPAEEAELPIFDQVLADIGLHDVLPIGIGG